MIRSSFNKIDIVRIEVQKCKLLYYFLLYRPYLVNSIYQHGLPSRRCFILLSHSMHKCSVGLLVNSLWKRTRKGLDSIISIMKSRWYLSLCLSHNIAQHY